MRVAVRVLSGVFEQIGGEQLPDWNPSFTEASDDISTDLSEILTNT